MASADPPEVPAFVRTPLAKLTDTLLWSSSAELLRGKRKRLSSRARSTSTVRGGSPRIKVNTIMIPLIGEIS